MKRFILPNLLIHVCSKHGDIEVVPNAQNSEQSDIRYIAVTSEEAAAIEKITGYKSELLMTAKDGLITVPMNHIELARKIAVELVPDNDQEIITAVRFSNGRIVATKSTLPVVAEAIVAESTTLAPPVEGTVEVSTKELTLDSSVAEIKEALDKAALKYLSRANKATLLQLLKIGKGEIQVTGGPTEQPIQVDQPKVEQAPKPQAVAAVQVRQPVRGCPMPMMLDLAEAKAASVVAKFLTPQQRYDFARHRAFLVRGSDTGNLYRVTSRWAKSVEEYGVLFDLTNRRDICASNQEVPPSEEVLGMALSIQGWEKSFLNGPSRH